MTAQVSESFLYQNSSFHLAAYSNGELFCPEQYGYRPVMASTACRRGYNCEYKVENGQLLLNQLYINVEDSDLPSLHQLPPDLNGSVASVSEHSFIGKWLFKDVELPLDYTGGLIIGQGFIQSLYVHMGFHPAWKYETVHELVFESGKLILESDLSSRMVEIREKIEKTPLGESEALSREQIESWIEECFRRDYKR